MATESSPQTSTATREAAPSTAQSAAQPTIKWDDSSMRSSYANVCNVASTREEVVLLFGINQAWNAAQREITVQLADRIMLSPYAAKRLATVLNNVVRAYESRWGVLQIDAPRAGEPAADR